MLRQNLKKLQEAQKLEKKCNVYIMQCKNQLDQLKMQYTGRSGRYMLEDTEKMKHLGNEISRAQRGLLPGAVEMSKSNHLQTTNHISNNKVFLASHCSPPRGTNKSSTVKSTNINDNNSNINNSNSNINNSNSNINNSNNNNSSNSDSDNNGKVKISKNQINYINEVKRYHAMSLQKKRKKLITHFPQEVIFNSKYLGVKPVIVVDFAIFNINIPCTRCGGATKSNGWYKHVKIVHEFGSVKFMIAKELRCKQCKKACPTFDENIFRYLTKNFTAIANAFSFIKISTRNYVDKLLLTTSKALLSRGNSTGFIADVSNELMAEKHERDIVVVAANKLHEIERQKNLNFELPKINYNKLLIENNNNFRLTGSLLKKSTYKKMKSDAALQYNFREKLNSCLEPPSICSIDHSRKSLKSQNVGTQSFNTSRLTLWNNILNIPIIGVSVDTESYNSPVLKRAFSLYCKTIDTKKIEIVYLDNPRKDANGVRKLLQLDKIEEVLELGFTDDDLEHISTSIPIGVDLHLNKIDDEDDEEEDIVDIIDEVANNDIVLLKALYAINSFIRQKNVNEITIKMENIDQRRKIHNYCNSCNLVSETSGIAITIKKTNNSKVPRRTDLRTQTLRASLKKQVNKNWFKLVIKYDPKHFIANFVLMAVSKNSTLFPFFCGLVADAIYMLRDGEYEQVVEHLLKRGLNEAQIKKVKRSYKRPLMRKTIPAPEILIDNLIDVYELFHSMKEPDTGRDFFKSNALDILKKELNYVVSNE